VLLGAGIGSFRYHRSDLFAKTLADVNEREYQKGSGAISFEGLCQVRVSTHLAVLLGMFADSADETLYRQPVLLLVIGR
jgi:hypothetical protein